MRIPSGFAFAVVGALSVSSALTGVAVAGEEKAGTTSAVTFEEGLTTFDAVLAKAKAAGKPAFLDFYSPT